MNTSFRKGETSQSWKRMVRYYDINGNWFFSTREKKEFGPFASRIEADKGLEFYLKWVGKMKLSAAHLVNLIQGDPWQLSQYK